MRTIVDIPEDDISWLDRRAAESGQSRAAIVREAVSTYRALKRGDEGIAPFFGLWRRYGFAEDGLDYQRRIRAEWDTASDIDPDLA
jgi:hypothetical protein